MIVSKNLGIWMDHANAHLIEFTTDPIETTTISSAFTHEAKEESLGKGVGVMHHKEQHQQSDYYKKLGEVIRNYEEVLLFGPTGAKVELFNILKADHHFSKVKIKVMQADKMSEHQQHAYVKNYFSGDKARFYE